MMETFETITPPTGNVVETSELRSHLRVNTSAEDTLFRDWLDMAAAMFETEANYVLLTQTQRMNLDGWPDGTLYIPRRPITSVSSVQYLDQNGTWQTVLNTDYATDLVAFPARITFNTGFTWPSLHETRRPRVRVQFVAGSSAANVDKRIKQAVKLMASWYYTMRQAYGEVRTTEMHRGWSHIIRHYAGGVLGSWNV